LWGCEEGDGVASGPELYEKASSMTVLSEDAVEGSGESHMVTVELDS
jgi:hypothetical protein